MSSSVTVIGGHSGATLTGLVSVQLDQAPATASFLQSTLSTLSADVTASAEFLNNSSIAGISESNGLWEITNTDSTGATTAGSTSIDSTVPSGYNTLIVQAPGADTITGNGAQNFLAIFGSNSSVNFTSDGGSGSIVASSGDFINVSGTFADTGWGVLGSDAGNDTINTTAGNTGISTSGAGNVIGLAGLSSTVLAGGSNDLIAGYGGANIISVTGGADVEISGGADTVYAGVGMTSVDVFFINSGGGSLDFINNSTVSASVTGGADGSSGSVTVFGGAAGGYYQGGTFGNNSLVGGSAGSTTLIGAGINNFLSVIGGTGDLFAGDGTATLVGGAGSTNDQFAGGLGTDSIVSFGSGTNSFFVGNTGSETLTGSTVTGASNDYYFIQSSGSAGGGGGTDVITNFNVGKDNIFINPFNHDTSANISTITGATIGGAASSEVQLSDNTIIKLVGVTFTQSQITSLVGGNHI